MIDMQSIITFLLGILATSIGACLNHLLRMREMNLEYLRTRKAVQSLFTSCIKNLIDYLSSDDFINGNEWDNKFWNDTQLTIAKYFPKECILFSSLLSEISFTEYFNRDRFRAKAYRQNARQLLERVEKLK